MPAQWLVREPSEPMVGTTSSPKALQQSEPAAACKELPLHLMLPAGVAFMTTGSQKKQACGGPFRSRWRPARGGGHINALRGGHPTRGPRPRDRTSQTRTPAAPGAQEPTAQRQTDLLFEFPASRTFSSRLTVIAPIGLFFLFFP